MLPKFWFSLAVSEINDFVNIPLIVLQFISGIWRQFWTKLCRFEVNESFNLTNFVLNYLWCERAFTFPCVTFRTICFKHWLRSIIGIIIKNPMMISICLVLLCFWSTFEHTFSMTIFSILIPGRSPNQTNYHLASHRHWPSLNQQRSHWLQCPSTDSMNLVPSIPNPSGLNWHSISNALCSTTPLLRLCK
jgi:hypothetical protein